MGVRTTEASRNPTDASRYYEKRIKLDKKRSNKNKSIKFPEQSCLQDNDEKQLQTKAFMNNDALLNMYTSFNSVSWHEKTSYTTG